MSPKETGRVIAFSNHKGGVGKTCSVCNVGAGLARLGQKVLLVDLDPQANLTTSLGMQDTEGRDVYRVLLGQLSLTEAIQSLRDNLDIVPSSLDLAGAEVDLAAEAGREMILREAIDSTRGAYDYVLIDCAPSLGLLTANALTASTEVYVPVQPQYLSLKGMSKLTDIIDKIKNRLNKRLQLGGVLVTQFDKRKVINREIAAAIETHFGECAFRTRIRDNVSLAEAPGKGQDIFRYKPDSNGARDYEDLCKEILRRHGNLLDSREVRGGAKCREKVKS